ncbi:unnamed protein product, partial [Polarella glacialis]
QTATTTWMARCLNALIWVALAVLAVLPMCHADGPIVPYKDGGAINPNEIALCVVDVIGGTVSLGQAGIIMAAADDGCKDTETETGKKLCSITLTSIIAYVGYIMNFLSAAATDCARTVSLKAYCVADTTLLAASLLQVAAAATSITLTCVPNPTVDDAILGPVQRRRLAGGLASQNMSEQVPAVARELQAWGGQGAEMVLPGEPFLRDLQLADCVFNAAQIAINTAAAANFIVSAVQDDCSKEDLRREQHLGKAAFGVAQRHCSVDMLGLISSFGFTAQSIMYVVALCPESTNLPALCAADITSVVASLVTMGQVFSNIELTCAQDHQNKKVEAGFEI